MDSTLNDFLNEINEIAPLKPTSKECDWKECFDSKSGFSYYWNIKTDEVTWETPKNFIASKSKTSPANQVVSPELVNKLKDTVKIYKIEPANYKGPPRGMAQKMPLSTPEAKKGPPTQSDSEDEKITLITSYGSESGSDDDNEQKKQYPSCITRKRVSNSEDEDSDILSTVRKRAEELKMLTHKEVKNVPNKSVETTVSKAPKSQPPISGFSLVAGYDSNSEEEQEEEEEDHENTQNINQSKTPEKTYSHSTLFPFVKPPDVNDFSVKDETPKIQVEENTFERKIFQRKRRLGVNFIPTRNLQPPLPKSEDEERKGFGFNSNNSINNNNKAPTNNISKSFYSNFTSGGVEFTKQDTASENIVKKAENEEENIDMKQIEGIYEILHEKLRFLCEGNKDVMPVQIILIQIETLFGALKANSLKSSYLYDWLEGTSEDLIRLETEAAPDGWILQWDRSQKRYYYHNQSTGVGQWEYPQPDTVGEEEAMDISTTPPPPEIEEEVAVAEQPPLPPSPTKSPSPPPPPIISHPDVIPEPPSAPRITTYEIPSQPLPPGVDYSEPLEYKPVPATIEQNDDINSAFDTFYSELAEIENTPAVTSPITVTEQPQQPEIVQEVLSTEPPKKKKKKVKLGQGLSLKKKDVSKLVEKWKNVQKNF